MGKRSKRVATDGGSETLSQNPFESLNLGSLSEAKGPSEPKQSPQGVRKKANRDRGRIDVSRQKTGRGGKTATIATGFKGIAAEEKAALAKSIQKSCGTGGAVKNGNIEIQGDKREEVKAALEKAGFRVVFTGG